MKGYGSLKQISEEHGHADDHRRVLAGDKTMIVWWTMKAGAHAGAHQHPHEQIFWMLKGRMDSSASATSARSCGPGDVGVIPGGVEHEAWFPRGHRRCSTCSRRGARDSSPAKCPLYMRQG